MMTTPAGVALSYRRVFVCATSSSVYEFLGRCTRRPKMNAATLQGKDNAVEPKLYMGSIGKINALFYRQEKYCWASELSNTRVLELGSGNFRAIHRPEALSFGAFWRLARVKVRGKGRLREMNRIESDVDLGSGYWESIEWP